MVIESTTAKTPFQGLLAGLQVGQLQAWGLLDVLPIRTNLRTQLPVREALLEQLGRVGMLATLIHPRA